MNEQIVISAMEKTWILDLDGTIVVHNGYKIDGKDTFLSGAREFIESIPKNDMIIFLTSRRKEYAAETEIFLKENRIRYNHIIYDAPYGERILINDRKPSGLDTAIAVNIERNEFCGNIFVTDRNL